MTQGNVAEVIPQDGTLQLSWLARLTAARAPEQVAEVIVALLAGVPGCRRARVVWQLRDAMVSRSVPDISLDAAERAWLRHAGEVDGPLRDADRQRVAICLCKQPELAVLLLELEPDRSSPDVLETLSPSLQFAGQCLQRALEWSALQHSHQQVERSENLQRALFAISDLAGSDLDMPAMLRGIHAIVGTLMYADNFFIVLLDAGRASIRFLYYVDVEDPQPPGNGMDMPLSAIEYTLTWYVLNDGKARMGDAEELRNQVLGPVAQIGPDSYDWLGVPMLRDGRTDGALVVQSYQQNQRFTREDLALLEFVGSHILTALERKQTKDDLEQRVQLRTTQLAEANRGLQLEILERQRAEHLQAALFQIAQLATADIDQEEFCRRVHAVISELLNAENFFIALVSDDHRRLTFPYAIDAMEMPPVERPMGRGLSEYVLRSGAALRVDNAQIEALEQSGEIARGRLGSPAMYWLGVPLIVGDEVIGLVTVQSYRPEVVYGPADQELLSFVASQVANSLTRRRSAESLRNAYEQLEQRVEERTLALRKEIIERERVQDQLRHQLCMMPSPNCPTAASCANASTACWHRRGGNRASAVPCSISMSTVSRSSTTVSVTWLVTRY